MHSHYSCSYPLSPLHSQPKQRAHTPTNDIYIISTYHICDPALWVTDTVNHHLSSFKVGFFFFFFFFGGGGEGIAK